jgi:hypothetical protein
MGFSARTLVLHERDIERGQNKEMFFNAELP